MSWKVKKAAFSSLTALMVAGGMIGIAIGSAPSASASTCSKLLVIGARGSGEPYTNIQHGLGTPNFVAWQQIQKRVPSANVYGLPYPATPLNSLENLTNGYWNSVSTGTVMLLTIIQQQVTTCPSQRISLLGYSQGAQVVADILPQIAVNANLRAHIATVTLFGDPRFNPSSPIDRGSYSSRLQGLEPAMGVDSARIVSSTWFPAMRSYCVTGDFICNWSLSNLRHCPIGSECGHFAYASNGYASTGGASAGNYFLGLPSLSSPTGSSSGPPAVTHRYYVYHTCANGHCGLNIRNGPGYTNYSVTRVLSDGDAVDIVCQTRGENVSGIDGSSSNVWDRLAQGDYAADFYIDTPGMTGSFSPSIPQC
jgi:hypothetical protein